MGGPTVVSLSIEYSKLRSKLKRLRVFRSQIHGYGVFTLKPIKEKEMIVEYIGTYTILFLFFFSFSFLFLFFFFSFFLICCACMLIFLFLISKRRSDTPSGCRCPREKICKERNRLLHVSPGCRPHH